MSETNYERYFGTPEKAAAYLACHTRCADCELIGEYCNGSALQGLQSEEALSHRRASSDRDMVRNRSDQSVRLRQHRQAHYLCVCSRWR